MSEADVEYLCVGVCMNDPDSGYCLGCGRPPAPNYEPKTAVDEASRYPVASELNLDLAANVSDAWEHLV